MEECTADGDSWDIAIVGAGMGGGTLGHALARAGWRVLFCEMGHARPGMAGTLCDVYPEQRFGRDPDERKALLRAAGRFERPLIDESTGRKMPFVPFIGSAPGGSSALYGMVLERFSAADFEPGACHRGAVDANLPDRWPFDYAALAPYYEEAERLYRVRGERDPLRAEESLPPLGQAPALREPARALAERLVGLGLHPYRLPLACEFVDGCRGCQGYLCGSSCKNDSARICVEPAIAEHRASLLDDCEVIELEADRERVTGMVCRRQGKLLRVKARRFVLAAGALATPSLLLRSRSADWPEGLANRSGLVGRNLMRHFVDLYAVFPKQRPSREWNAKELGCNDYYHRQGEKLGSIQSFGHLPPGSVIAEDLKRDLHQKVHPAAGALFGLVKPLVAPFLDQMFARAMILATIIEDLPYGDNRVLEPDESEAHAIRISYRLRASEQQRIQTMRSTMKSVLAGYRHLVIKQAENNQRIAHACGTCRAGMDPRTSVVDASNRTHDLENLYIVDASFFPSSGGTNPALTIAANALRVAKQLSEQGAKGGAQ